MVMSAFCSNGSFIKPHQCSGRPLTQFFNRRLLPSVPSQYRRKVSLLGSDFLTWLIPVMGGSFMSAMLTIGIIQISVEQLDPSPFSPCNKCHDFNKLCLQARPRARVSAVMETKRVDEEQQMQIEGLKSDYCDDFVCTSSPAVEQTVRSLARDLVRRSWTPSLFTRDVRYTVSHGAMGAQQSCIGIGRHAF